MEAGDLRLTEILYLQNGPIRFRDVAPLLHKIEVLGVTFQRELWTHLEAHEDNDEVEVTRELLDHMLATAMRSMEAAEGDPLQEHEISDNADTQPHLHPDQDSHEVVWLPAPLRFCSAAHCSSLLLFLSSNRKSMAPTSRRTVMTLKGTRTLLRNFHPRLPP